MTYHPTPFGKFNRLDRAESHIARVMIKMIANNIPVYATHTSWDCVEGGVNDWLLDSVFGADNIVETTKKPVEPHGSVEKFGGKTGFGRVCELKQGVGMGEVVAAVKKACGLEFLRRADPIGAGRGDEKELIRRVAVVYVLGDDSFVQYLRARDVDVSSCYCLPEDLVLLPSRGQNGLGHFCRGAVAAADQIEQRLQFLIRQQQIIFESLNL